MNKKLVTVLAATCVLGAATAFAANPFSDVTPDDWAYQSVAQLAAEGVIDGYPDGTFGGERNITRYEMAQMVARAMAREDQANAEQQAQIDRLASEFANELNSLGVRVSNLEDRVGNVKITGDARLRYKDDKIKDKSMFDMRMRVNFNAKVAENTKVSARLTTDNFGFDSDKDPKLTFDRLFAQHSFSGFTVTAGRYGERFGQTGYWYDSKFDGAKLGFKAGDFAIEGGYGTLKDAPKDDHYGDVGYAKVAYNAKQFQISAGYLDFASSLEGYAENFDDAWTVGLAITAIDQLKLSGDYVSLQGHNGHDDAEFWMGRLEYGKLNLNKPGSWNVFVDYVDAEDGAYLGGTVGLRDTAHLNNTKSWGAGAAVVLAKNLKLEGMGTFNSEYHDGTDSDEYLVAQLVYKF